MTMVDPRDIVAPCPKWAEDSSFSPDTDTRSTVFHRWTAPTVASGTVGSDKEPTGFTVALIATDNFVIEDTGVRVRLTDPVVYLPELNASFSDSDEARRFTQAIIECCDRLDFAN